MSGSSSATGAQPAALLPSLAEFESLAVDPGRFDHEAHLYVAWSMLGEASVIESMQRYTVALRALTAKLGAPEKYHETLTCCLILLVAERMQDCPDVSWDEFKRRNGDLLQRSKSLLLEHYSEQRLFSVAARQRFLLPDRAA